MGLLPIHVNLISPIVQQSFFSALTASSFFGAVTQIIIKQGNAQTLKGYN